LTSKRHLNETDSRILEVLQRDGRRSYADLAADLGMSAPSAHERVKKLEARGVITGYGARVDPAAVGLGVLAFTWVTQAPGTITVDLASDFAGIVEIEECHRIAGEADYLLKIRARDMEHLGTIVHRVQATRHVFTTATDVVFNTGFERRPLAVGASEPSPDDSGRSAAGAKTTAAGGP
jgi:Lrp/AsnC family leucine-responsive transcriptional regulator